MIITDVTCSQGYNFTKSNDTRINSTCRAK